MANRLRGALSPYLEQHADNPVDWWPWCPEALQAARTADRPILLSIGYSACHWCHVMADESFEDDALARRMNDWFVNIKVDREERPDLDRVYQLAHQLLTGHGGGWPLTVFLDPTDLMPFVAGTYFPPESRHGRVGFGELLERVHDAWLNRRDALRAQNRQLGEALDMLSRRSSDGPAPDAGALASDLVGQLEARRDRRHGGFGEAPKFPQAPLLEALLKLAGHDEAAAGMLGDALDAVTLNGLFDQIGGGFFRYTVDQAWEIPHFEKMLIDNALLLPILAEAAVRWQRPDWARTAERTVEFLLREMRLTDGGFATSLAADSVPAGESGDAGPAEGAYYLWTREQFDAALPVDLREPGRARFGLDGPANFEQRAWHPVLARSKRELIVPGEDPGALEQRLEQVRSALLAARLKRPRPARDDKLLASVNALTAIGLRRAARAMARPEWAVFATETLETVWQRLFATEPPHAAWRDGRAGGPALLDDWAAVLLAMVEQLADRPDPDGLQRAETVAEGLVQRFVDRESGMAWLTARDHEGMIMRPRAAIDDAAPGGAGLAARALLRLGRLSGDAHWQELAGRICAAAGDDCRRAPAAHATLLVALNELGEDGGHHR